METKSSQPMSHAARWRRKLDLIALAWCACLVGGVWTWHLASWAWALIPWTLALILRVLLPSAPRDAGHDTVWGKLLWVLAMSLVFWSSPVRGLMTGFWSRLWTLDSLQLTIGLSCLCVVHWLRYAQWLRRAPLGGLLAYYEGAGDDEKGDPARD
jgi:hypothetical protein